MNKIIVTTSWDDGFKNDIKLLALLDKYNLKGTFYVQSKRTEKYLSDNEIKEISVNHEVGAHSVNHKELDKLGLDEADEEIKGSKIYFDNLLEKETKMFCYPRNKFNDQIKQITKSVGFLGARSTRRLCFCLPTDFFDFGVTLNIYPFPFRKKNSNRILIHKTVLDPMKKYFRDIIKLKLPFNSFLSWENLAKNSFDYATKNGQIFHLYGHSWEIEKYSMWRELENVFKYIANRPNILYLTNGEVLEYTEKSKN